jgi:DNA-binding HxlR family transcriptional regulator
MKENSFTGKECQGKLASIDDALYVIGGKWKLRIIVTLKDGINRFNELQRTIKGISARVLSNELKDLEMNGFVRRNVYDATPVIIEYELTDYANTLGKVLESLSEWGEMHRRNIRKKSLVKV